MSAGNTKVAMQDLIERSQGLREKFRQRIEELTGKEKWKFVVDFTKMVQNEAEKLAFASAVEKEVIDGWTDEDLKAMGVDRAKVEEELRYTEVIVPMAEVYQKTERRKEGSRARLVKAWGADWEEEMKDLMPGWHGEEFLRHMAKFAEDVTLSEAKIRLRVAIGDRIAKPRTKKDSFLMIRDFKAAMEVVITHSGDESVTTLTSTQVSEFSALAPVPRGFTTVNSAANTPPAIVNNEASQNVRGLRKRKSWGQEDERRRVRKFVLEQAEVVNLDVDAEIEALEKEAEGEEDKDDVEAVREAMKGLMGKEGKAGEKVKPEVLMRRLEKMMKAVKAEVVELEDE